MRAAYVLGPLCMLAMSSSQPAFADVELADRHQRLGLTCLSCHSQTPPASDVEPARCTQCHGTVEQLVARTANMLPNNVHDNHLGETDCLQCHHAHKATTVICDECHQFAFKMP